MKQMQQDLSNGTDIDTLKTVLGANLDRIKHELKEFVEHDHQRYENAEQRNQDLQQRLSLMEQESAELRQQIDDNRKKLMFDALTKVRNRLAYDELIEQEFARFARYKEVFSYALFDIDHFKRINDNYGHHAGDNALRLVAAMMNKHIRKTDFLCRIGGEEFAMILPKTTRDQATPVIEQIRAAVGEAVFHYQGQQVTISLSAGLTESSAKDDSTSLYQRADKALYAAKNTGRDRTVAL